MMNKTNTIPIKGTVVETILKEFREKYEYPLVAHYPDEGWGVFDFRKTIEAFLSSALERVQAETAKEIVQGLKKSGCKHWQIPEFKENMTTEGMVVRAVTGHKSSIAMLKENK